MIPSNPAVRWPALPPPPPLEIPYPDRLRLANGLEILLVHRPRLPLIDALLVVRSGTADDSTPLAGTACLTAELLDAGTPERSQTEIANEIDLLGARFEASATWDCTSIALQVLAGAAERALHLLADIAVRAAFPVPEFNRGRQERLASILQDLDDPDTLAGLAIARVLYGEHHAYGLPPGGTLETVERVQRSALVGFHDSHYRPANAFLVLVGDSPADLTTEVLDRVFGSWRPGQPRSVVPPAAMATRPMEICLLDRPGAPQSEFRIGAVGAARTSADFFPLVVLNTVLGGTFTSRLNLRLREQSGYTYGAFSRFAFRRGAGPFIAGAAVQTEVTDRAIAESFEEMARLRREPVDAEELARAKQYLTLGLARSFETNGSIASRLAELELYGLSVDYWSKYSAWIAEVGAEAVMDVAQRYLHPERTSVVVVGDAANVRSPVESLGIGPVRVERAAV